MYGRNQSRHCVRNNNNALQPVLHKQFIAGDSKGAMTYGDISASYIGNPHQAEANTRRKEFELQQRLIYN